MIRVTILLLALGSIITGQASIQEIYQLSPHHQAQSIIVVGRTGVGKSTLCNLLAKNKLTSYLDQRTYSSRYRLETEDPDATPIGHDYRSETLIPKLVRVRDDRDTLLWDIPGSAQNRGPLYELISGFSIKLLFRDFQKSKVIVMLSEGEILEEWDYRLEASLQWLSYSMVDQRNVVLVISKVTTSEDIIYHHLQLKIRDMYQKMDRSAKVLDHLIAFQRVGFFYSPKKLAQMNKTQSQQRQNIFNLLNSIIFQKANLPSNHKSYIFSKRLKELEPQIREQMNKLIVNFQQKCVKNVQIFKNSRNLIDLLFEIRNKEGDWEALQKLKIIPQFKKVVKDEIIVFHKLLQYMDNSESQVMRKQFISFVWTTIGQLLDLINSEKNTWATFLKSYLPVF